MQIEWKIVKKRGNMRPLLMYTVHLEEHEKALALPPLRITSTIPEPKNSWQDYCYPGQLERSVVPFPAKFYDLEIPSHKGRMWQQTLRLPWRCNNNYSEVEDSFQMLRQAFEKELAEAYSHAPVEQSGIVRTSPAATKHIAPGILAEKLLRFAHKQTSDQPHASLTFSEQT